MEEHPGRMDSAFRRWYCSWCRRIIEASILRSSGATWLSAMRLWTCWARA